MSLGRRDVLCPSQTLAKGWEATRKGEKGQLAQWEMELEKLGRDFGWNKKWAQKEEKKKKETKRICVRYTTGLGTLNWGLLRCALPLMLTAHPPATALACVPKGAHGGKGFMVLLQ